MLKMEVNNEIANEQIGGFSTNNNGNNINFVLRLMVSIYKNFKFVTCMIICLAAVILVILAMVEFGKEDEHERKIKTWFYITFSASSVIVIILVMNYLYIKDRARNMDWAIETGIKRKRN